MLRQSTDLQSFAPMAALLPIEACGIVAKCRSEPEVDAMLSWRSPTATQPPSTAATSNIPYGLSAPGKGAQAHFGFDVAHVLAAARQQLARRDRGIQS